MKRITDLFLIVLLLVSVLPMSGLATMKETKAEANVYTLMKPDDLTDTAIEERGPLGSWGQSGIKRQDVEVITFLDSTETAPRYVYDFSEKADQSILGWIVNGELFVAAEGRIRMNQTSSFLFAGMKNLTQINFNGVVDTSRAAYLDHLFQGCEKLEEIDLTDFDTTSAVDLSAMFYGCKKLEELDVSGFDTSKVENMHHMFTACKGLEELDLSTFETPKLKDMKAMFDSCRNLETVDLSSFDTSHVTDMSNLFGSCDSLERLDLSNFDTGKTQNMNAMFANCKNLTYLDISGFTGKRLSSTTKMFLNVGNLKTFYCNDETIIRAYRSK